MALINIEYGALASSETMNRNFSYLDDKISEKAESVSTRISSISSQIATINSRIDDISDDLQDTVTDISSVINQVKTDTTTGINAITMLPNWAGLISISKPNQYVVPANGYLLLLPVPNNRGNLQINSVTILLKEVTHENDNASLMYFIPLKKRDKVTCGFNIYNAYFLPISERSFY
ncbi:MAG: hypothetical protein MJ231_05085 [bacterium]|nr:hypothetical protein [bacterium]